MVDMFRKKKDGTSAYKPECDGLLLGSLQCDGDVGFATKKAGSFGQPFTTHSYLCDAHAERFGYKK